ncbi:hypothetical protein [Marinomonas polaris]|uniref:hypothetical protein n=1 Tax=Marinomonas polaris TaxID=293552 RepID=UPI003F9D7229
MPKIYDHQTTPKNHPSDNTAFLSLTGNSDSDRENLYTFQIARQREQKQLDGLVAITSGNKNYRDMTIPVQDLSKLKIIGRVVWSGHPMI